MIVLACALATPRWAVGAPAPSAPDAPTGLTDIHCDQATVDLDANEIVLQGHARVRDDEMLFTADEIHYNKSTETLVAIGHAAITFELAKGSGRMLASQLDYNHQTGILHAHFIRASLTPWYVSGDSAEGTRDRIVIHHAEVTYNEPGKWRPTIRAEPIIYSPGHYLRLGTSRVGIAGVAMIPLWHSNSTFNASAALTYLSFDGGYRSNLGAIGTARLRIPVTDWAKVGADLSVFTSRGVMLGPAANYQSADGSDDLLGSFRSGAIYDYGNQHDDTDLLGNSVPRSRGYVEWRQMDQVTDNLTVDGELNYWSDSEVIRDFYPKEFYGVQEPDNFVESVYTQDDYFASVFARFQPDSYEPVQERLPELSFDEVPTAIGAGFYERTEASAVQLIDRPPGGGQELADDRYDLFYGLQRPVANSDWYDFVPVVGGRITRYSDTTGADSPGGYTRLLGEVGFDARMMTSGTFDYANPVWDIDGLRHLLDPILSYRYIPQATAGQKYIPPIDAPTFSPYLQPLELGDIPYIDQLHPENTLRIGLDNTLQTRDSEYGSRDLVTFDLAEDIHLQKEPGVEDFDDIHTDLGLTPAKWLGVDVATIVHPENLALREVETGVTIKDADVWTLHLGNDFLTHENDDYVAELVIRLNEEYRLHLLSEYDDRLHLFPEQSIALEENLVNTWAVRYVLTFSQGPNVTGHFGFAAQVDLLRF